jgi:hypothetical protein
LTQHLVSVWTVRGHHQGAWSAAARPAPAALGPCPWPAASRALVAGLGREGDRITLRLQREAPMRAKPGDEMAAAMAGRGRLRASRADREHVIDVLKNSFVQGLLTKDEFDARVSQTLASRTYAELAALTADIPAGLAEAQPLRRSARPEAPAPVNKVVNSCACATLAVLAMSAALFTGDFELFFCLAAATLGILFIAGASVIRSSREQRSSEQRRG